MDDDYDDDIADEDLMLALGQDSGPMPNLGSSRPNGVIPVREPLRTASNLSNSARQSVNSRGPKLHTDLDDLPSDAFDSSPDRASVTASRPQTVISSSKSTSRQNGQQTFRQTTLFGSTLRESDEVQQSQVHSNRVYRADLAPETPTHHALDHEAMKTWVYPTNLGPIRDYQYSIVKNGLFNNTLVALPTGLGKTFIAATIILNYYRWTKNAKMVFVAPTKPLTSQQVEACLNVAGIPRSQTTLLTGETPPAVRAEEWESRRLFFMTPQTLQNDLSKGYADPKSIALLVIDEAHRATGDYAYVKVVSFLRRFHSSFRVLALTATPGASIEGVQEVIDNLGISHVEIRTEESIDIRQYVHSREIDRVVLEPSDEILHTQELFSKALKPICDKLSQQNIWYGRDPMALTTFGLVKARQDWANGPARHLNDGTKFMVIAIFTILMSLAHSIKLLKFHGIKPFYDNLLEFRSSTEDKGEKGSKYKRQIVADESFQEMMDTIGKWLKLSDFVSHPKMAYLCDNLLNYFMDAGQGSSNTRAIVFSEYRDSAEEIVRTLNTHKPLLNASIFVGQADSKRSAGMKQKQQIETIEKFKSGTFNILVATSIGEEGLDIGQVDLIICYDASSSPIRMLQRMGRTGRKRAGNIVLLLMKGKEEDKFAEAQDNYAQMQKLICEGSRFNFRHDLSSRIVPRDIRPEVDKRFVEVPFENTQNTSLPEPRKSKARTKKAPQKKFHMPDDVETGFTFASAFGQSSKSKAKPKQRAPVETDFLADIPALESVLLNPDQLEDLDRLYRDLPFRKADEEEIEGPSMRSQIKAQRVLRRTVKLKHGQFTKRCVRLFKKLGEAQNREDRFKEPYGDEDRSNYRDIPVPALVDESDGPEDVFLSGTTASSRKRASSSMPVLFDEEEATRPKKRKPAPKPRGRPPQRKEQRLSCFSEASQGNSDDEEAEEEDDLQESSAPRRGRKSTKPKPKQRRNANWEERGDDCMRTSDNYESEGSDNGSDLVDFIVGSDEVTSSMRRENLTSPTSATESPPSARNTQTARGKGNKAEDLFFVPTNFTQTQGSEDDLPDVSVLAGTKQSAGVGDSDDEALQARPAGRKRRRLFVAESDSE